MLADRHVKAGVVSVIPATAPTAAKGPRTVKKRLACHGGTYAKLAEKTISHLGEVKSMQVPPHLATD